MKSERGGWEQQKAAERPTDHSERPSIWVHCWWSVSALLSCTAPCHRHWLARETLVSLLTANWLPFTSCSTALLIRSKSTTGNSVSACHYHWPNNGSWHEGRNKQTKRTTICLYGTHWMLDKRSHRERIFRHGYACGDQRQELNHLSNYVNGEIGEESNVQCSHATSCPFEVACPQFCCQVALSLVRTLFLDSSSIIKVAFRCVHTVPLSNCLRLQLMLILQIK